jgi:hypothetical protein
LVFKIYITTSPIVVVDPFLPNFIYCAIIYNPITQTCFHFITTSKFIGITIFKECSYVLHHCKITKIKAANMNVLWISNFFSTSILLTRLSFNDINNYNLLSQFGHSNNLTGNLFRCNLHPLLTKYFVRQITFSWNLSFVLYFILVFKTKEENFL